jgi:hypothetical protein
MIFGNSGQAIGQDIQAERKGKIELLIAGLGTRYWDKSIEGLVQIGEPAVGPLIAALRPEVRFISSRACLALARIGTSKAVDAVFQALAEGSAEVRREAANALQYVGSDRALGHGGTPTGADPWPSPSSSACAAWKISKRLSPAGCTKC